MLQICLSDTWTAVCDYSFGCTSDGRAACRQLGYSGSEISMCTNVCHCAAWYDIEYFDKHFYTSFYKLVVASPHVVDGYV